MKYLKHNNKETERFVEDVERALADQPVPVSEDMEYQADLGFARLLGACHFMPDQRFENRLRHTLLDRLYEQKEMIKMSPLKIFRSVVRPMLMAAGVLVLLFGVLFAASPDIRAAAMKLVARFVEVDSLDVVPPEPVALSGKTVASDPPVPSSLSPDHSAASSRSSSQPEVSEVSSSRSTQGSDQASVLVSDPPTLSVATVPSREFISLEDAQSELDFTIRVPAVLPEGYEFLGVAARPELPNTLPDIGVELPDGLPKVELPQSTILVFSNASGELLTLSEMYVTHASPGASLPAGRGGVQEVEVSGQSAQYVAGRWTEAGWVADGFYRLHWQDGDILYDLSSHTLALDALLPVAESIE